MLTFRFKLIDSGSSEFYLAESHVNLFDEKKLGRFRFQVPPPRYADKEAARNGLMINLNQYKNA